MALDLALPSEDADLDWFLRRHGLASIAAAVAPVRWALELAIVPARAPAPRSRAGGDPDLPAGVAWPVRDGVPLPFLLQLDLAEVDRALGPASELPVAGLLSVFGDGERFAVLHVDGALSPVSAPPGAASAPVHAIRHRAHLTLPDPTSRAVFAALEELRRDEVRSPRGPSPATLELHTDTREWWERGRERREPEPFERYCDLRAEIEGSDRIGDRLLGHASSVQDDAVAEAGADRLLLQLSSKPPLGWEFAGDGVLYLCIDDAELRAGRFERVVACCQR
jgi:hypothetical protein